jgi:hypothetical protein
MAIATSERTMRPLGWVLAGAAVLLAASIACSSSAGATQCGLLDECCSSSSFPAELYPACNSQGAAQDETACSAALQGYGTYCGGGGGGVALNSTCVALAQCCATAGMGDEETTQCYAAMQTNNASMCSATMSSLCGGDDDGYEGDDGDDSAGDDGSADDSTGDDSGDGYDAGYDADLYDADL